MIEMKDAGVNQIKAAGKKLKRFVGTKEDAEQHGHEIDNEFIHHGYRIHHNSWWRGFKSLFQCHNETVNVWSHLCGSVFYLLMLCALLFVVAPS